ncbi:MAG: crossover junction endodeoxyribonuclease RuvC [Syntrophobacteraceae bacterium]|nr:crossover junction endodeoxyribonuclease RuvC [Syntrophobacteraceae bacterium]
MESLRTIGIDPGSRATGYGIVEGDGRRLRYVASGVVSLQGQLPLWDRLGIIYTRLTAIIHEYQPGCMAVEDVFLAKNVKSALKLGHARGAAILAGVNAGLGIHEYSALQIKQAVVGYGRAAKDQVEDMVRFFFGLKGQLNPNASDALAVALCHLNTGASLSRWKVSSQP